MKLKNIFIGLGCVLAFSSCTNEMDYHEYTVYGKDYVFTDFTRTSGFVTNIYSYLDSDLPSNGSLSSACDESEYAGHGLMFMIIIMDHGDHLTHIHYGDITRLSEKQTTI